MSSPDNNGSRCQIPQRQQSPETGNSHLTDNGKPVDPERPKYAGETQDENNYCEPAKPTSKIPGQTRKGTNSKSVSDAKGEGTHNPQS
ncbi:hypothetical protein TWF106_009990 [Orbilia oligospora]|uniref:Uncharacterized protein n=1 Tax=Orbilia oligospora TaxID=2813651 RepID=A0A7C8UP39_ORBOL|nr:hypothetical protein TWF106_009990 [Orbilia oligospora]